MRLEPIREQRTLRAASPAVALQAIADHAAGRGKVLERSPDRVVLRVGSAFAFRMLGTYFEAGRRSIPTKVTVTRTVGQPHLDLELESQETGYLFRAPWMAAAYDERFREVYAELERATTR